MPKNLPIDENDDTDSEDQDYIPEGEASECESIQNSDAESEDDDLGVRLTKKRKHETSDETDKDDDKLKNTAKQQERTNELWSSFLNDVKPSDNKNKQNKDDLIKKIDQKTELNNAKKIQTSFFNETSNAKVEVKVETNNKPLQEVAKYVFIEIFKLFLLILPYLH
jgi:hypothetical protein